MTAKKRRLKSDVRTAKANGRSPLAKALRTQTDLLEHLVHLFRCEGWRRSMFTLTMKGKKVLLTIDLSEDPVLTLSDEIVASYGPELHSAGIDEIEVLWSTRDSSRTAA